MILAKLLHGGARDGVNFKEKHLCLACSYETVSCATLILCMLAEYRFHNKRDFLNFSLVFL